MTGTKRGSPFCLNCSFLHLLFFLLISAALSYTAADALAQDRTADKTLKLKALAGLQYDKVQLAVQPGSVVEIVLENADEMMHNLLVTSPGARKQTVAAAEAMGEEGMENNFIPEDSDVLAAIPLLKPGESDSVIFRIPEKEGAYPYVCTYPAHGVVMYGVIHATENADMLPPVEEDPGVPEMRRKELWNSSGSFHPYPMEMPLISRLFMPEASPAAIVVGMEGNVSYCWDASVCHLRYSWSGGYIDPSEQWDAKATELARIVGEVFFRNEAGFPFQIGKKDSVPDPEFRGYELVEGYPRFMYTMGDISVSELIMPAGNGNGLEITYRLDTVQEPVWYELNRGNGYSIEASAGKWDGNMLSLNPEQAREFKIFIVCE